LLEKPGGRRGAHMHSRIRPAAEQLFDDLHRTDRMAIAMTGDIIGDRDGHDQDSVLFASATKKMHSAAKSARASN